MNNNRNHNSDIATLISNYYSEKLAMHGPTPKGVDWNNYEGQSERFYQLCKLIQNKANPFTMLDIGCGYGELLNWLDLNSYAFQRYTGVDLSPTMIESARTVHGINPRYSFYVSAGPYPCHDYCVASGIFNVKMEIDVETWEANIFRTLHGMNESSSSGFAFNLLTAYSDPERQRNDLYYGDPSRFFEYSIKHFSRNVALIHDYDMFEFTVIVRKTS